MLVRVIFAGRSYLCVKGYLCVVWKELFVLVTVIFAGGGYFCGKGYFCW